MTAAPVPTEKMELKVLRVPKVLKETWVQLERRETSASLVSPDVQDKPDFLVLPDLKV